ncbi:MAG: DUF2085 domain-containing protein [Actinomycetota bacterium]
MSILEDIATWFMDQVGYAICHQLPSRSLAYGGRRLPVCARDTGLFLGFAACFLLLLVVYRLERTRYPSWPKVIALALFVLPMAVDVATSYGGLRQTTNIIRLTTGALAGVGAAALLFPLAARQWSQEDGIAFESWWSVPALLAVPAVVTLAVYPGWSPGFWLWAPLVTLSILFTFLVLNVTLAALLLDRFREDRPPVRPAVPVALGAALVALELVISNLLHHAVA